MLLTGLIAWLFWCQRRLWVLGNKLDGPPGYPLFGNIIPFLLKPKQAVQMGMNLWSSFYPRMRIWFGPFLIVVTSNPSDVKIVLTHSKILKRSKYAPRFAKWLLGEGVIVNLGDKKWNRNRKVILSSFHSKMMGHFQKVVAENMNWFISNMNSRANGKNFDIHHDLARLNLRNILTTILGIKEVSISCENIVIESLVLLQDSIVYRACRPWLLSDTLFQMTKYHRRQQELKSNFDSYIHHIIDKKIKEINTNKAKGKNYEVKSFLDEMIINNKIIGDDLIDETKNLIVSTIDTSLNTLGYAFCCIGILEEIQEKIFQEQFDIFGEDLTRQLTMDDLNQMTYLEMVLKETLRLFPPIPCIPREIECDIVLEDGKILPKGTKALINIYSLHRNSEFYPNPERFNPDNFLPDNIVARNAYAWIPFSGGARKCIGQRYAYMTMKSTISTLIRHFKIGSNLKYRNLREAMGLISIKEGHGFYINLISRNSHG